MKKVTLINPPSPWLINDRVDVPLGLLYLAGFTRTLKDVDVNILDLSGGRHEDYEVPKSDIYGISFTSPQLKYAVDIKKRIRKEYPDKPIVAGGIHATALPNETLAHGFDYVVRGEGELALEKIINDGVYTKIVKGIPNTNLDTLPFPAYDLLDMKSYLALDVVQYMKKGDKEINIMASRGCNGKCIYCTSFKGSMRQRSPESVIDEINMLREEHNVDRFYIIDDNLTVNRDWLIDLCSKLKENKVNWHCLGRADQIDKEIAEIMVDSGCMGVTLGIETGSQKLLDVIRKETTVEAQEQGMKNAHDSGLKVRSQMIVGLPQEEETDHQQTLDFIVRNKSNVDKWGVHIFIPFPSSPVWRNPEKFGYKINKDTDFADYQTIGKPSEWNFKPVEHAEDIARRREEILNLIGGKNIFVKDE